MRYLSVVKADAYGHGMPQMAKHLMQCGVDYFGVANVDEATGIRHMGAGWPILILSPVLPEETQALVDYDLMATISTAEEAERLNRIGQKNTLQLKVHLKIDTGMGRLGVWHQNAEDLINRILNLENLQLSGVYTHFSSADTDPEFTSIQRQRFLEVVGKIRSHPEIDFDQLLIHADNSSSLNSLSQDAPFNAVRVGLLQLGIQPYPFSALSSLSVEPVFSFYTRVGITKELPAGTDISYGRTHKLKEATKIAILTAGYGDGIPLELSNTGEVLIKGTRCPIIGRVTMDQTIVDISKIPEVEQGDVAVLIGQQANEEISCEQFSQQAKTIPWESLCSISKRVSRVYVGSREL